MYITYLDQNAVIDLGVTARKGEFCGKLDAAIGSGAFTPMVSSWHLVETANTTNLANATELAEFIDSLKPVWLLERQSIQRLDVREDFMVARIRDIMYSTAGPVVGVVGYGHLKSLARALASIQTTPVYSTSVTWNVSTG